MEPNNKSAWSGGPAKCLAILLAFVSLGCAPAHAAGSDCRLTYAAADDISEIIDDNHFRFEGYDELCQALKAQGLMLSIDAHFGVLTARSYGFATIRIMDERHKVKAVQLAWAISMNEEASTPAAKNAAMDSINTTLARIAAAKADYIHSWQETIAKLRLELAAKP